MGFVIEKCCLQNNQELTNDTSSSQISKNPILKINSSQRRSAKGSYVRSLSHLPIKTSSVIRKRIGSPFEYYKIEQELGKGSYGTILKISHKLTGQLRAMKMLPKNEYDLTNNDDDIEREFEILRSLDHPNIIKIYDYFNDNENIYLITELCSEGSLSEKLQQMGTLSECIVKILMCQIFTAVKYLHSKNVIHGDLKLENVMLDTTLPSDVQQLHCASFRTSIKTDLERIKSVYQTSSDLSDDMIYRHFSYFRHFEIKLIDFGCSKIFSRKKENFQDKIGTTFYAAPEVLGNNYNEKCDIWACGVMMYLLLSGEIPFMGRSESEIENKIQLGKFKFQSFHFQKVSFYAKDLIKQCLTYDPKERISAEEALNHQFFRSNMNPHNIFDDTLESQVVLEKLSKAKTNESKFYEGILTFLTHNFAKKDQITDLKHIFRSIDANLDGKISKEELIEGYHQIGMTLPSEEIDRIYARLDIDNSGFVEYAEFLRAALPKEALLTEDNLKSAFDLFDTQKKGMISCKDLREIFEIHSDNTSDNVMHELLSEINKTEDDKITFTEFLTIVHSLAKKSEANANANANDLVVPITGSM